MEQLALMRSLGLFPTGILHVGANTGQEFEEYRRSGAGVVVYVEPVAEFFSQLNDTVAGTPNHYAVKAVCSDRAGDTIRFNIASNGESSSMLGLGAHAELYPHITYVDHEEMQTTTVDAMLSRDFADAEINLMVLDVQGAELKVLQGAERTLEGLDAIYTEVAEQPLYEGGCTWREIDALLAEHDFSLKSIRIGSKSWGNAFFVRNSALDAPRKAPRIPRNGTDIARGKPATQSSYSKWSRPDDAQGAVSGRLNGSYHFHTEQDESPWWQVDLGREASLDEVLVFNRIDASSDRAYDFILKVGPTPDALTAVHSQDGIPFGGVDGRPARVPLTGRTARYVRIELPRRTYLHLDGVEVYGEFR